MVVRHSIFEEEADLVHSYVEVPVFEIVLRQVHFDQLQRYGVPHDL